MVVKALICFLCAREQILFVLGHAVARFSFSVGQNLLWVQVKGAQVGGVELEA